MSSVETRYGYLLSDWDAAKEQMRAVLVERAKAGETIPYSELVKRVHRIHFEAHSHVLDGMLEEISVEEDQVGRGMLSVIVVHKRGDMQPGRGFFKLAKKLGRGTSNITKCWVDEFNRVLARWRLSA